MDALYCIIDDDPVSGRELTLLLEKRGAKRLVVMTSVPAAMGTLCGQKVSVLFIRVHLWEHYTVVEPLLSNLPGFVIYLSGRGDRGMRMSLPRDLHLQPPYSAAALERCLRLAGF
jgi:hypothetical protein